MTMIEQTNPAAAVLSSASKSATVSVANSANAIDARIDEIYYGKFLAVRGSHIAIEKNKITGFIGPSGCGKSTVLRSLNRMNDLIPRFRLVG